MKNKKLLIGIAAVFLLAVNIVHAQALDILLEPLSRFDIASLYQSYGFVIDCMLYFLLLVGAAQAGLSKMFEGRGGKAIIIGVGLALSISICYWEAQSGFRLANLWPLALIIVFVTFGIAFYNMLKGAPCSRGVGLLAFAFLFFFFQSLAPSLEGWFSANPNEYVRLIWSLLQVAGVFAIIWGIIELIRCMGSGGSAPGPTRTPSTPSQQVPQTQPGPQQTSQPGPQRARGPGEGPEIRPEQNVLQELIKTLDAKLKLISRILMSIKNYYKSKAAMLDKFISLYENNKIDEADKVFKEISETLKEELVMGDEDARNAEALLLRLKELTEQAGEGVEEKLKQYGGFFEEFFSKTSLNDLIKSEEETIKIILGLKSIIKEQSELFRKGVSEMQEIKNAEKMEKLLKKEAQQLKSLSGLFEEESKLIEGLSEKIQKISGGREGSQ